MIALRTTSARPQSDRICSQRKCTSASPHNVPPACGDRARRTCVSTTRVRPLPFGGFQQCEYRGKSSCTGQYRSVSRARRKSHDNKVGSPTKLSAVSNSPLSQGFCGLPKQLRRSQRSPNETSAQPKDGCQANLNRPTSLSRRSCTKLLNGSDA